MDAGIQAPGPPTAAFQAHMQGRRLEVEQLGHQAVTIWDASVAGGSLPYYATMPALALLF